MPIINLTPHAVVLSLTEGGEVRIPPSGQVARVAMAREHQFDVALDGRHIPVFRTVLDPTKVEGLPSPERDDTAYIVSRVVAEACRDIRSDLFVPDDTVRDDAGRIIGCRALAIV